MARRTVYRTSQKCLTRIVDRTPKPPTPTGQIYERTGRLVAGWGEAGAELRVAVPKQSLPNFSRGPDLGGSGWEERTGPDIFSFTMRNRVPYALFVEEVGPGFPVVGVGYHMVLFSLFDTMIDFQSDIQSAWAAL